MIAAVTIPPSNSAPGFVPHTTATARSTAAMMPATASANSATRRTDVRRASAWRSKKFMCGVPAPPFSHREKVPEGRMRVRRDDMATWVWVASPNPHPNPSPRGEGLQASSELHLRRRAHRRLLLGRDLQQCGLREVEHAGDYAGREHFALVVVGHDRVVVGLA